MDKKIEILLGSEKNIASVNVDTYDKVELVNKVSEITEFDVNDVMNSTEEFDAERADNPNYRIYGRIEYMSLLNGLINNQYIALDNYKTFEDFFNPIYTGASKNIINSFQFYLVKPAVSGYTEIDNTQYVRYFEVIATPNNFDLFPAGFSNNVYNEQGYSFNFNTDFDVSEYFDEFGFPITELFLYAQYNLKKNGNDVWETMKYSKWNSSGTLSKESLPVTTLSIGNYVETITGAKIGDIITYNKSEFSQIQTTGQTIYISTEYKTNNNQSITLVWKFNPFIPFRLRYFNTELNNVNTGSTSYDLINSIPSYATKLDDDGNMVWRDINPQGYVEPLTGIGVNYPFFNKRRYLFSSIILDISPDLNDAVTRNAFTNILFNDPTILDITPKDDLDNIGKPCQ